MAGWGVGCEIRQRGDVDRIICDKDPDDPGSLAREGKSTNTPLLETLIDDRNRR